MNLSIHIDHDTHNLKVIVYVWTLLTLFILYLLCVPPKLDNITYINEVNLIRLLLFFVKLHYIINIRNYKRILYYSGKLK